MAGGNIPLSRKFGRFASAMTKNSRKKRRQDGYTLVEASVGWRFFLGATVHDLLLSGTNLTDEEARVHTSFLKEQAPLPGRDLRLSWRVAF